MVGWVLRHINLCKLFNAKSSLYMYFKYMICKHFVDKIFQTSLNYFLHTVKWFQASQTQIILFTINHLFTNIQMNIHMICKGIVSR